MGVVLDIPKFPVVDRAPSLGKTVSNFSLKDYAVLLGITGVSFPIGYSIGLSTPLMARPTMYMTAILGAYCGFSYACQQSAGRLMGLLPNDAEVNKYLANKDE